MTNQKLKFPDDLFSCKLGVGLGRGIIWRYKAGCRLALDKIARLAIGSNGCAPMPRFALIGNN